MGWKGANNKDQNAAAARYEASTENQKAKPFVLAKGQGHVLEIQGYQFGSSSTRKDIWKGKANSKSDVTTVSCPIVFFCKELNVMQS